VQIFGAKNHAYGIFRFPTDILNSINASQEDDDQGIENGFGEQLHFQSVEMSQYTMIR
jgi:hypothetical protein